jgi:hypothetical protein
MNKYLWHSSLNRKMGIERPIRAMDYYEMAMVVALCMGAVLAGISLFFALICA